MKARSKTLRFSALVIFVSCVSWSYQRVARYIEIHSFFKNSQDLAWASAYLDKEIDFCNAPWSESIELKTGDKRIFYSPSRRFKIEPVFNSNNQAHFILFDAKTGRSQEDFTTPINVFKLKWTKDERFLVFSTEWQREDWDSARIYITNAKSGQTIYFGETKNYDCPI